MTETRENLCRINWRMSGDLRALFKTFSDNDAQAALRTAGHGIIQDAEKNLAAKGWHGLGDAIRRDLNTQINGRTLEVGSSHPAAGMRHLGGTISAPGKSPLASRAEWLTIPVPGPAKGNTARDMRIKGWKLFRIISTKTGFPVLMGSRGKGTKARPLFAMRKEVTHPKSPWFPTFRQITTRIEEAFRAQL